MRDFFNSARQVDFQHFFGLRIDSIDRAVKKVKVAAEHKGIEWTTETEVEAREEAKRNRRKRVWDGTFKKFGLPLSKDKRGPRGKQVAYYYLDPENRDIQLFLEMIAKDRQARLVAANAFAGIKLPTAKAR